MKNISSLLLIICAVFITSAQEKKIKFNEGVLRICSSKNFQITGYDGDEVIIKSLHKKKGYSFVSQSSGSIKKGTGTVTVAGYYNKKGDLKKISESKSSKEGVVVNGYRTEGIVINDDDSDRKEGLKKLGKNKDNSDLGIYFTIEEGEGELIFKDKERNNLVWVTGEKYEIKVPNSIMIQWLSGSCSSNLRKGDNNFVVYRQEPSRIKDFKGELSINTTIQNTELIDVSGPVSLNSLGGNFTIIFDKTKPNALYSVYTNNGFIDVTLPEKSNINIRTIGKSIFSDLDFEILADKEINDFGHTSQEMNLKLNSGKVKMNLNAGYGNVYLRKK